MTQIGRLIGNDEIEQGYWDWDVFDALFNDNPGYGKYYINLNVARDEQGQIVGHSFSHMVFDGTNSEVVAVDANPLELVDKLPWRFHVRARMEVAQFMSNEYPKLL